MWSCYLGHGLESQMMSVQTSPRLLLLFFFFFSAMVKVTNVRWDQISLKWKRNLREFLCTPVDYMRSLWKCRTGYPEMLLCRKRTPPWVWRHIWTKLFALLKIFCRMAIAKVHSNIKISALFGAYYRQRRIYIESGPPSRFFSFFL